MADTNQLDVLITFAKHYVSGRKAGYVETANDSRCAEQLIEGLAALNAATPPEDAAPMYGETVPNKLHFRPFTDEDVARLEPQLNAIGATMKQPADAALADEHVAWLRYNDHGGQKPTTIHLCDSDAPGAFKVYRDAPAAPAASGEAEVPKGAIDNDGVAMRNDNTCPCCQRY